MHMPYWIFFFFKWGKIIWRLKKEDSFFFFNKLCTTLIFLNKRNNLSYDLN